MGGGGRGRARPPPPPHMKTIAASRRKQEQHNITHLLHVNLALPNTNSFHNHVSVTRSLAELNHLVRVLGKPLSKAKLV